VPTGYSTPHASDSGEYVEIIEFRAFNEYFGNCQVLEDIVFSVDEDDVVMVVGPSGSGKSTLLHAPRREMVDLVRNRESSWTISVPTNRRGWRGRSRWIAARKSVRS
jgi:ABC-type phosphate transport system ATPase subunit